MPANIEAAHLAPCRAHYVHAPVIIHRNTHATFGFRRGGPSCHYHATWPGDLDWLHPRHAQRVNVRPIIGVAAVHRHAHKPRGGFRKFKLAYALALAAALKLARRIPALAIGGQLNLERIITIPT